MDRAHLLGVLVPLKSAGRCAVWPRCLLPELGKRQQGLTVSCLPSSSSAVSIFLCGLVSSDPCQDAASRNSSTDATDAQVGREGTAHKILTPCVTPAQR